MSLSRAYLIGLLESGAIAHRGVGRERRILASDVAAYKAADDERRQKAAADLTTDAEESGIEY